MEQAQARKRARELSRELGRICVADTVKPGAHGGWTRGGWPSPHQTWAVLDYETGHLIEVEDPKPLSKRESDDLTYGPGGEENDEADEEEDRRN